MILYILIAVSSISTASAILVFLWLNSQKKQLQDDISEIDAENEELQLKLNKLEIDQDDLIIKKTEAETRLSSLKEQLEKAENEISRLKQEKEAVLEEKNHHMREERLAMQRVDAITREMENWQKSQEKHMENARASVLAAGSELSSKLLDDHKRETESTKKENEKLVKDTTEELHKKFNNVFESMHVLHEKVNSSANTVDLVKNSLLNPGSAGSLAEISLENIFKASGLVADQDYKIQHHMQSEEGRGLRPDAVIFLPGDNIMAVDSKASKFFLELGQASDEAAEKAAGESLKKTMNNHLKDLLSRDYKDAVERQYSSSKARIVMYLPTDAALEKLRKIDNKFEERAYKEGIIPVGPAGLVNLLLQSRLLISNAKQEENSRKIIAGVKDMINSVVKLHELANNLGKSIKGTTDKFDKFAGSFDRNFMAKARKISQLGADVPKINDIKPIDRYNVDLRYKEIEGEMLEEDEIKALESE